MHAHPAHAQLLARLRGDAPGAGSCRRRGQLALDRGRPARAAVEHDAGAEAPHDRQGRALVVGLGVRQHQHVEPAHTRPLQAPQDRPTRGPGVDQDGRAGALEERRVALTHVEERDDELVAGAWAHGRSAAGRGHERRAGDERSHRGGGGQRQRAVRAARRQRPRQ